MEISFRKQATMTWWIIFKNFRIEFSTKENLKLSTKRKVNNFPWTSFLSKHPKTNKNSNGVGSGGGEGFNYFFEENTKKCNDIIDYFLHFPNTFLLPFLEIEWLKVSSNNFSVFLEIFCYENQLRIVTKSLF